MLSILPRSALAILRETAKHVLRHPVIGIVAAAHTHDGRWLLVRRADTGSWALPGGTLEWGETLVSAIERELHEETGMRVLQIERVVGIYSRPDRDTRFHAVTVLVKALVDGSHLRASNPLEIREVRLFPVSEIPHPLAFGGDDLMRAASSNNNEVVFE